MNKPDINEINKNHENFLQRLEVYKNFGYDFESERNFVLKTSLPINGNILEVGTGKGHFSLALAKAGYKFTTVDISEEEHKFALMNLQYSGLENNVQFVIGNAEKLQFADKTFDTIISVNMIHHLENSYKVIDEMLRLLNDKGKLVITDFSPHGFDIIQNIHKSENRFHETNNVFINDIHNYLSEKGYNTSSVKSKMQEILILSK